MAIFEKIKDIESYYGEVVDVTDDKMASRIKVRVKTVFDQIPVEVIPWAIPRYLDGQSHDLPAIGDTVQVKFLNNDKYYPMWYRVRGKSTSLSESDYVSGSVVFEKELDRYGLDGRIAVRWTESEGMVLQVLRSDNDSTITIRNDNTIVLTNGQTQRSIHLSNDTIVLGSEDEGQQPATVGDDNVTAHEMINDMVKTLSQIMDTNLTLLSTTAQGNPYTSPLAPIFKAYGQQVKQQINQLHKANDTFFPETLSKVVTIDKT